MQVILETSRLSLRRFTEDDAGNLFALNSDPAVTRYLTGGKPTPLAEIRDRIIPFHLAVYRRLDRLSTWAAESTATGELVACPLSGQLAEAIPRLGSAWAPGYSCGLLEWSTHGSPASAG